MHAEITLSSPIKRSARVLRLQGMFDDKPAGSWSVRLPIEERLWNVGPSGAGKSTITRML
ncbi:hypothetical protein ACIBQ1_40150 [Nonomuraea sp. NPDC050153]|uniref:hypothetical protein n=1 Tax=Nonomuraea sp. NPDC050153 TaxID=3364359 RepID=UPI0037972440